MNYGRYVWRVTTAEGIKKDYKLLTWAEKFANTLDRADITLTLIKANGSEESGRRIRIDGVSMLSDWERKNAS